MTNMFVSIGVDDNCWDTTRKQAGPLLDFKLIRKVYVFWRNEKKSERNVVRKWVMSHFKYNCGSIQGSRSDGKIELFVLCLIVIEVTNVR